MDYNWTGLNVKLLAGCIFPFFWKVWWQDATLFVYIWFITYIHSFNHNTFIRRHSLKPLSISSSLVCSVGKTQWVAWTCILLFWIGVILVPCKESWRRFCTLHTVPAVRQVVFADVQITIRQRVAVLLVLGYWSELCSYWLTQNQSCLWLVAFKMTLPQ